MPGAEHAFFGKGFLAISREILIMSSLKRKSLDEGLQRRVRARRESSEELESEGSVPSESGGEVEETSDESQSEAEEDRVCPLARNLMTS
jgi:ribosomal RNA-processing protein 36